MIENIEAFAKERVEAWAIRSDHHRAAVTTHVEPRTAPKALEGQGADARMLVDLAGQPWATPPTSATVGRPNRSAAQWSAASLFCGLGGLDLGFALAGTYVAEAYDKNGQAVGNYNRNLPAVGRVADLSTGPCPAGRADILLAGAPCQGFSTTGKREVDDPRNLLLARIADAAAAVMPRVIVIENVPAATSGSHGRHWYHLEERLRWSGFNVRRVKLDGKATGLAQTRQRLFMICWRGSEHRRVDLTLSPRIELQSALADVVGLAGHDPRPITDPTKLAIAVRIAAGQKLSNVRIGARNVASWELPEVYGRTTNEERRLLVLVARMRRRSRVRNHGDGDPVARSALAAAFGRDPAMEIDRLLSAGYLREMEGRIELRHTFNGKYRRLHWSLPAPTVDSHFGRPSYFLHPTEHRGLTLREAMRLQGLPDWYTVRASANDAFKMVGDAVPPPMAGTIAAFVRDGLLKD